MLSYLRSALHCRVWLDGELLRIEPTWRCPPRVVDAVQRMAWELGEIVASEFEGGRTH